MALIGSGSLANSDKKTDLISSRDGRDAMIIPSVITFFSKGSAPTMFSPRSAMMSFCGLPCLSHTWIPASYRAKRLSRY